MDAATVSQPIQQRNDPHWYEEFGLKARFPRPPLKELGKLFDGIQEPQIFLRTEDQSTDVVIRLPTSSRIFPTEIEKEFAQFGVTLPNAFEDILWEKLEAEGSTTWRELARLAIKAYQRAWDHWAELQYLGHFHPAAEGMFKTIQKEVKSASKGAQRGRRPSTRAELASLKRRYEELLPKCAELHEAAQEAVRKSCMTNNEVIARKEIRRSIWEQVRRNIHGMPGDGYVFGGQAFKRIRYGAPKLHHPKTWEAHQLAIALLSLERGQAYQTIEKKLVPTKHKRKS